METWHGGGGGGDVVHVGVGASSRRQRNHQLHVGMLLSMHASQGFHVERMQEGVRQCLWKAILSCCIVGR